MTDDEIASAVAAAMPQPVDTVPVEEGATDVVAEALARTVGELPSQAAIDREHPTSPADELPEIEVIEETPEPGVAQPAAGAPEPEEVDLSSEWASLLEETKEHAPPIAGATPKKPAEPAATEPSPWEPLVPAFEDTGHSEFHIPAEHVDAHAEEQLLPYEELTALPGHAELAAEGKEPALEEPQAARHNAPAPEPEFELDQEFELVLEPEKVVPPHEMLPPVPPLNAERTPAPVNGSGFATDDFLADLAREIDEIGLSEPPEQFSVAREVAHSNGGPAQAPGAIQEPAALAGEHAPLKEVFDEFRAELGEMASEDEDLETHYNLGIAFREMGLLEEAIGEFQKVAKANDRGKAFRYAMQCCTLLGLAFMGKGQPNIAAIWYERALNTPGVDGESKLALRYDLGVAQESAGDLEAALKSFSQVYAVNIDYRDVAERIASLQKPAR